MKAGLTLPHGKRCVYCNMDELALSVGQDPLEFRRKLMGKNPKHLAVLNAVAERIGWGTPAPKGVFRGLAQFMATGYPLYRLEWQSLGSLQRRLRNCITGMRAQSYDYGAPELVELELYLMTRARGMPIETPAVRP